MFIRPGRCASGWNIKGSCARTVVFRVHARLTLPLSLPLSQTQGSGGRGVPGGRATWGIAPAYVNIGCYTEAFQKFFKMEFCPASLSGRVRDGSFDGVYYIQDHI